MNYLRKAILLKVLFLTALSAEGQNQIVTVLDKRTGEPVPYAYVCLESLDKKIISNNMTDIMGNTAIDIRKIAQIAVSSVGYITVVDTIEPAPSYTYYLEQTTMGLGEVVVTGQPAPQRSDRSIYKVNVISSLQIEEKAAQNLQELLQTELNIRPSRDNILGAGITVQGLSGENVKILVDGVPVVGRQNGIIDLSQINLSNVDHIEIVEGPMSVIYGSNALAGVVNIITKQNQNSKMLGRLNTYYESAGVYNGDASFSFRAKNNLFSFNGGRNFFGGFSVDPSLRSFLWKPKEQYEAGISWKYGYKGLNTGIHASLFSEQLRNPGDLSPSFNYEKAFDEFHFTRRYELKSESSLKLPDNKGAINFLAAWSPYSKIKRTYLKNLVDLTKIPVDDPERQDTVNLTDVLFRGYYSSSADRKFSLQTGFDINMETGTGKRMDGRKSINEYAGFLSTRYKPVSSLSIQPGIRLIYNSRYKAPPVYSLSMKWDPLEDLQFRVSAGQGFRSPSLKELYLDFRDSNHNVTGNPDLLAEKSFSLNGSANWSPEFGKNAFTLEADGYYNRIKNKIDLLYDPIDPTGARYMNIPGNNYVTKGGSLEMQYRLHPRFTIRAGLNIDGKSKLDDFSRFNWSESVISGFNYKNLKYRFILSLDYKYTGIYRDYRGEFDQNGKITSVSEVYMNDYNLMDINLSRPFFNDWINLSAGVKNLFNVINVYSIGGGSAVHGSDSPGESSVGWGRTFYIKMAFTFHKY